MALTPFPSRRLIRLRGYDYTQNAAYFVTVCATQRLCLFGEIKDGVIHRSALGDVVASAWLDLPFHTPGLALDAWVVMPNHLHGLIILPGTQSRLASDDRSPREPKAASLGAVVGEFKSAVSRSATANNLTLVRPLWQRNYYERIIRNDRELDAARTCIEANPGRWHDDPEHSQRS